MLSDVAAGLPVNVPASEAAEHPATQVVPPTEGTDKERLPREPTRATLPTPVSSPGAGDDTRRRRKSLLIAGAALAVALVGGGTAAMVTTTVARPADTAPQGPCHILQLHQQPPQDCWAS
ncbi:hypothetical protein [Streptomyces mirabilis]